MFKITIQRTYKYKYVIYRNRRVFTSFNTKKDAKLKLQELYHDFSQVNRSQNIFQIFPLFLRGGDALVVYFSRRCTLADSRSEEFKDYFEIKREINTDI